MVYLVMGLGQYSEGSWVQRIFSSEAKAEDWIAENTADEEDDYLFHISAMDIDVD